MYELYMDMVRFPVMPSKIKTKIKNQNKTITLINEGEINILKPAGLSEISFEILLPQVEYPFAVYPDGFKPALYYLDKLEALKVSQQAFNLKILKISPSGVLLHNLNKSVSLEDYEIVDDAKEGLDITVSVNLKLYKEYGKKIIEVNEVNGVKVATITTERPEYSAPKLSNYTVQSGDTLWSIAKKYLGDGSKFRELAKLNNINNPNFLETGKVIKLDL